MGSKGRRWQNIPEDRISAMHELYMSGASLASVAEAFDRTRQSVFELFRRYGLEVRPSKKIKAYKEFNGSKYTLRNNGYYGRTDGSRSMMHRDVWVHFNGDIPDGHDIHHKDHDKENNDIGNLECISKSLHRLHHLHGQNQHTKKKGDICGS